MKFSINNRFYITIIELLLLLVLSYNAVLITLFWADKRFLAAGKAEVRELLDSYVRPECLNNGERPEYLSREETPQIWLLN